MLPAMRLDTGSKSGPASPLPFFNCLSAQRDHLRCNHRTLWKCLLTRYTLNASTRAIPGHLNQKDIVAFNTIFVKILPIQRPATAQRNGGISSGDRHPRPVAVQPQTGVIFQSVGFDSHAPQVSVACARMMATALERL